MAWITCKLAAMTLLDTQPKKPALLDRVTLKGLLIGCAILCPVSGLLDIYLSFAFFTAADKNGYIMDGLMLLALVCTGSGFLFVILLIVSFIQRRKDD